MFRGMNMKSFFYYGGTYKQRNESDVVLVGYILFVRVISPKNLKGYFLLKFLDAEARSFEVID